MVRKYALYSQDSHSQGEEMDAELPPPSASLCAVETKDHELVLPRNRVGLPTSVKLVKIITQRHEQSVFFQTLYTLEMIISTNPQAKNSFLRNHHPNIDGFLS